MTARPTVPVFAANDSSLTNLQNLSASVGFLGTTPMGWHLYKNSNQGPLATGSPNQITFNQVAFDPDGVASGGGVSIVTRGYYDCESSLNFSNTGAAGETVMSFFKLVTGSSNPLGSGVSIRFGSLVDLTTGNADQMSVTLFGTSPCLYPGDTVQVFLRVTGTTVTVSATWNNSGNNDLGGFPDGGPYFTGQWVSEGP